MKKIKVNHFKYLKYYSIPFIVLILVISTFYVIKDNKEENTNILLIPMNQGIQIIEIKSNTHWSDFTIEIDSDAKYSLNEKASIKTNILPSSKIIKNDILTFCGEYRLNITIIYLPLSLKVYDGYLIGVSQCE